MTFIASYSPSDGGGSYYRTVRADSLNEAIKQADRWARKGYICVKLEQRI